MQAALDRIVEAVRDASKSRTALCLRAGGTKDFYGNKPRGTVLTLRELSGIVAYDPSELVVTVRAATRLEELENALSEHNQMLAFEPPHFGSGATVGGCVASGIAGPRRLSFGYTRGSVRDFVLGAHMVNGRGELLSFGGTVMKNVAGYDVARVLAGSLGILGVIVQLSLKVVPKPARDISVRFAMDETSALASLNDWALEPLPISASVWCEGALTLRLSGATTAVSAARARLGGEELDSEIAAAYWQDIREQRAAFFSQNRPLWRLALPSTAEPVDLDAQQLIEWGGAQRWMYSAKPAQTIRERAHRLGGHATLFRGGDRSQGVFTPLAPAVAAIHRSLKAQFDPAGIFNPGRMFESF